MKYFKIEFYLFLFTLSSVETRNKLSRIFFNEKIKEEIFYEEKIIASNELCRHYSGRIFT